MKIGNWLPTTTLEPLVNLFTAVRRRVWSQYGKAHIELPALDDAEYQDFTTTLVGALTELPGVYWACPNGATNRMIVAFDDEILDLDEILTRFDDLEARFRLSHSSYGDRSLDHPGDTLHITRNVVSIGADLLGAAIGLTTFLRPSPGRSRADLAALFSVVDNTPHLRGYLTHALGYTPVETAIGLVNPLVQGFGSGPFSPLVDMAYQICKLRESLARKQCWNHLEPQLTTNPDDARAPRRSSYQRPLPIPDGPIEQYANDAWNWSLGAFAVGLADTQELHNALTALLDVLPKPARFSRGAFASSLSTLFSNRGTLVMDKLALRRLDRINTIIIDDRLLIDEPLGESLIQAIRKADLEFILISDDPTRIDHLRPDRIAPPGDKLPHFIEELQRDFQVVALLTQDHQPGLQVADISLGFRGQLPPIPWHADLIADRDLQEAILLVEAIRIATRVSHFGATLAGAGAAIGAFSAIGGLKKTRPGRVMIAVNAASLVALLYATIQGIRLPELLPPAPPSTIPWHRLPINEVLQQLQSSPKGLTSNSAHQRHTPPPAPPSPPRRFITALATELANPLTPVLAAGAAVSAIVGSAVDASIVAAVIATNGLIGGIERFHAEKAIANMARHDISHTLTRRDDQPREIPDDEIVVGDILLLQAGDVLPADCRILSCIRLEVDQSSLSGESLPVPKSSKKSHADSIAERSSMLYQGTVISTGQAEAVVVATGSDTEARRAFSLSFAPSDRSTGVENRLSHLTDLSLPVASISGAILMSLGVLRRQKLTDLVGPAVNLAIGAVPEGLPLLSTTAQLAASRRLAERNVLVHNPRVMEALGRADVLCIDKTGTLTEGSLTLHSIFDGEVALGSPDWSDSHIDTLRFALRATPPPADNGEALPHATDQAIIDAAHAADVHPGNFQRFKELPFSSQLAIHAVVGSVDGHTRLFVKGAPETVLPCCSLSKDRRDDLHEISRDLAGQGLRILAIAARQFPRHNAHQNDLTSEDIADLNFKGFVALSDPLRSTANAALDSLRAAGVSVIMLTGDHPHTARRIASDVGLLNPNAHDDDRNPSLAIIEGPQLEDMTDAELDSALLDARVLARTTPTHKVRIVNALQRAGKVVAMTGDGANDAAAIRLADIGIALGDKSSAAARDAADLVVADSRVETIVDAVVEGRAMWRSLRDAVSILIGGNLGEILFMLAGGALSKTPPLNARQLLLINLFTDVAPALATALRPPPDVSPHELLHEGPEESLGKPLEQDILFRASITASSSFAAWFFARHTFQKKRASTIGLLATVTSQLGQTFTTARPSAPVWIASLGTLAILLAIVETPGLSHLLGCRPLGPVGLTTALTAAAGATAASALLPRIPTLRARLHDTLPTRQQPSPDDFFNDFYAFDYLRTS